MKEKFTCYIIDDEPLAQEILEEYISKVAFLELKGTFASPLEAAGSLQKDKPDLLFLDTGFCTLKDKTSSLTSTLTLRSPGLSRAGLCL